MPSRHDTSCAVWTSLGLLLGWACLCWGSSAHAELVYSKSRRFRIPFQFDAAELKRLHTKEVQLFVSRDGGAHWTLMESVSPDESRFTVTVEEDGVYWFSVKIASASGLTYPAGPHQAGLNVQVDTAPPKVELKLEQLAEGRIRLIWTVADENLVLNSLKLEFKEPGSDHWNAVAVKAQTHGQTEWTTSHSGEMLVRAEVVDLAGNLTQSQTSQQMTLPRPGSGLPEVGRSVTRSLPEIPPVQANASPNTATLVPRLTSTPASPVSSVKETVTREPSLPQPLPVNTDMPATVDIANPAVANPSRIPHKVNSNAFRINYNLDGVGPSGVSQVDLYITEDDGKKWFHYGQDPDRMSPMEVNVPRDGEYGLTFRVTNGLGRAEIPPQPNEAPELRVTVDRTPPVVRLLPLQHGQELDQNKVIISWTAQDTDLAERPIALFFSVAATGPWEPIQSWQPNSGRFTWPVPPTLNQPFYIRLDVRDNSGNVTRVYGEKPFLVDRSQPRARVTEVESINAAAR